MKKSLFFAGFAAVFLTFAAFGQPDAPRELQMVFSNFKVPATCYAMGLNQQDFSRFSIAIDLSHVRDKSHGLPVIRSISGVQLQGKPRFTYLQLENYYGYKTVPAPITIKIGEKLFPVAYISMEKYDVVGSTYAGDLKLMAFESPQDCMIRLIPAQ